jgi:hypothetical protein
MFCCVEFTLTGRSIMQIKSSGYKCDAWHYKSEGKLDYSISSFCMISNHVERAGSGSKSCCQDSDDVQASVMKISKAE